MGEYSRSSRLTQPVTSPARLGPWQSQACAATSASPPGSTPSNDAAFRYTTAVGFQVPASCTEITRSIKGHSPARSTNELMRAALPLVSQPSRTPAPARSSAAGSAAGCAGNSLRLASTEATWAASIRYPDTALSACPATSANGAYSPVAASAIPSRRVRVNHSSNR